MAPMKKLLPNWGQKILKVPVAFGEHPDERLERRVRRPDVAGEFGIAFGIEGDQQQVVNRQQPPDQQHDREHGGPRRIGPSAPSVGRPAPGVEGGDTHSCTSLVWSRRVSSTPAGISTGSAAITAATPRSGRPLSSRNSTPTVARTPVDPSGAPFETMSGVL